MKKTVKTTSKKLTATKIVKAKNSTKVTDLKTKKTVTYLNDGVTGKSLMKSIYATNNAHKQDGKSFSFCIKRVIEFGDEFFAGIKGFNVADLTPKNLIPLRTEKNALKEGFSVYEMCLLIKKFYATK